MRRLTVVALALALGGCGVPAPAAPSSAALACNAAGATLAALSEAYRGVLRAHSAAGWGGCASAVCREGVVDQVAADWRTQGAVLEAMASAQAAAAALVGPACVPVSGPKTAATLAALKRDAAEPQ